MRTAVVYLLALAALVTGAVFGFPSLFGDGTTTDDAEARASGPPPVIVARATEQPFRAALEALGDVLANESVRITPNRADHVAAIHFTDGQRVAKGDLLVELNAAEERALLDESRAILSERQITYDRVAELSTGGIAAEGELDEARSLLDAARARVAGLEATIADREIRAPFDGTLGLRHVSVGAFVEPNTLITTLDDLSVVKLDFTIPETWLPQISPGMPIVARSDAWRGELFEGRVTVVDTRIDTTTRAATIRAELPNPDTKLRPGMLLKVRVERGEAPALQVPEEALIPIGDDQHVLRVDETGLAERVPVQIGRRRVGAVEILSGLSEGERVVIEGLVRVRPGERVTIVSERELETDSE